MPIISTGSRATASFPADQTLSLLDLKELDSLATYSWTVETRYHGPTNTKGSRISAAFIGSRKGSRSVSYRHSLSGSQNHLAAAVDFMQHLSSMNGAPSYALVAMASTPRGQVFTFV